MASFSNDLAFWFTCSWACACPSGANRPSFYDACQSGICLAIHPEQAVQLLSRATGEFHLLFTSDNVGRHLCQACLDEFVLSHTIKSESSITFAQSCRDGAYQPFLEHSDT